MIYSDYCVDDIIKKLRENGNRITRQRRIIIEQILKSDGGSVKEIHYNVSKIDKSIGIATIYKTINLLEKNNVINKEIRVSYSDKEYDGLTKTRYIVKLTSGSSIVIDGKDMDKFIKIGLESSGKTGRYNVKSIRLLLE